MTKIVIAIAVVMFLAVVVTLWQGNQYREFMKTAVKTTGRIVSKEERATGQRNNRKEMWVTYRFSIANMEYTSQELLEYPDIYTSLRTSYPVDIYYNKNKPSECHLAVALDRRLGIVNAFHAR